MESKPKLNLAVYTPYIYLLGLPMGIAMQTATLIICFILVATEAIANRSFLIRCHKYTKFAAVFLGLFLCSWSLSTLLNPENPARDVLANIVGYIPLFFSPWIALGFQKELIHKRLSTWCTVIAVFWFFIVFSQNIWGWKLSGSQLIFGTAYVRPQGFYSHPLTLAYCALMLFPLLWNLFLQVPIDVKRTLWLLICLYVIYITFSRTVQAVSALVLACSLLRVRSKRIRSFAILIFIGLTFLVAVTNNPISQRFAETFQKDLQGNTVQYPDDRVAFWHAHIEMIRDRPLLGHGIRLDRNYRLPYFEKIGLGTFPRIYEAHNQYIQTIAESGFVGFVLITLAFIFAGIAINRSHPFSQSILLQTVLAFVLGGLTQNAFFDGEVRYVLIGLMALGFAQNPNLQQIKTVET